MVLAGRCTQLVKICHTMPKKEVPIWFHADKQVAYIQQFLIKSVVHPWQEAESLDGVKAPLAKIFTLLEEIENFHLEEDENHSISKQCYHVSESVIKPKKSIKPLFPEYGCLLMSPALFWSKNSQRFQSDPSIIHTIHKYQVKAIQTSPSIKDLLFGVPSRETGLRMSMDSKRQTVITYAVTLILKDYDHRLISSLRKKLSSMYPAHFVSPCKDGSNCENSSDSGGVVFGDPVITHIHFKQQIGWYDLIPLLSTYFIMGCYIYFSVRKINFVKSKLGMAFSAVISIMASLMMSVGLCTLFGLKPILNGGEIFPYLVIIIGLENILVITKSVVATPINLEVDRRIALGLSREGCSITKNLLLEFILIGLGFFSFTPPEIQEFCAFAVVGVLTDSFMHMVFFTSVLSIDIRRLDISEDMYTQPRDSDDEDDYVGCSKSLKNLNANHESKSNPNRKKSVLGQ